MSDFKPGDLVEPELWNEVCTVVAVSGTELWIRDPEGSMHTVSSDICLLVEWQPTVGQNAVVDWAVLPVRVLFIYGEQATVAFISEGNVVATCFVAGLENLKRPPV